MCHEVLSRRLLWKFEGQSIPAFVKNKVLHAGVKPWCRKLDWHRLSDITLRVCTMGFWRETERQSERVRERERVDKEHHACHRIRCHLTKSHLFHLESINTSGCRGSFPGSPRSASPQTSHRHAARPLASRLVGWSFWPLGLVRSLRCRDFRVYEYSL